MKRWYLCDLVANKLKFHTRLHLHGHTCECERAKEIKGDS